MLGTSAPFNRAGQKSKSMYLTFVFSAAITTMSVQAGCQAPGLSCSGVCPCLRVSASTFLYLSVCMTRRPFSWLSDVCHRLPLLFVPHVCLHTLSKSREKVPRPRTQSSEASRRPSQARRHAKLHKKPQLGRTATQVRPASLRRASAQRDPCAPGTTHSPPLPVKMGKW